MSLLRKIGHVLLGLVGIAIFVLAFYNAIIGEYDQALFDLILAIWIRHEFLKNGEQP